MTEHFQNSSSSPTPSVSPVSSSSPTVSVSNNNRNTSSPSVSSSPTVSVPSNNRNTSSPSVQKSPLPVGSISTATPNVGSSEQTCNLISSVMTQVNQQLSTMFAPTASPNDPVVLYLQPPSPLSQSSLQPSRMSPQPQPPSPLSQSSLQPSRMSPQPSSPLSQSSLQPSRMSPQPAIPVTVLFPNDFTFTISPSDLGLPTYLTCPDTLSLLGLGNTWASLTLNSVGSSSVLEPFYVRLVNPMSELLFTVPEPGCFSGSLNVGSFDVTNLILKGLNTIQMTPTGNATCTPLSGGGNVDVTYTYPCTLSMSLTIECTVTFSGGVSTAYCGLNDTIQTGQWCTGWGPSCVGCSQPTEDCVGGWCIPYQQCSGGWCVPYQQCSAGCYACGWNDLDCCWSNCRYSSTEYHWSNCCSSTTEYHWSNCCSQTPGLKWNNCCTKTSGFEVCVPYPESVTFSCAQNAPCTSDQITVPISDPTAQININQEIFYVSSNPVLQEVLTFNVSPSFAGDISFITNTVNGTTSIENIQLTNVTQLNVSNASGSINMTDSSSIIKSINTQIGVAFNNSLNSSINALNSAIDVLEEPINTAAGVFHVPPLPVPEIPTVSIPTINQFVDSSVNSILHKSMSKIVNLLNSELSTLVIPI